MTKNSAKKTSNALFSFFLFVIADVTSSLYNCAIGSVMTMSMSFRGDESGGVHFKTCGWSLLFADSTCQVLSTLNFLYLAM